jgi:hypothetical protein
MMTWQQQSYSILIVVDSSEKTIGDYAKNFSTPS